MSEPTRREVVERYGPWLAHNVDLGDGVFTIGEGKDGVAGERIARITQIVCDLAGSDLTGVRVLDLGALEGGFSIELARRGATVTALEGREEHAQRAKAARDVLGLDRLEVIHGDVRQLRELVDGEFDVVLALGLLYHLEADGVFKLLSDISALCGRLAIIETQISLKQREEVAWDGRNYHGMTYSEPAAAFASVGNKQSFWLTRASLINAVQAAGFTSVSECLTPVVEDILSFRDHVTLTALKGDPIADRREWPEEPAWTAHPAQAGLRDRLSATGRRRFRRIFSPGG